MIPNGQLPAPDAEGKAELRRGFALVTALLALVVVGALVTGSFFAASRERQMGLGAHYNDDGMYVAENALNRIAADSPKSFWQGLTASRELDSVVVSAAGTTIGSARVWVRPTGSSYFIVARGASSGGGRARSGGRTLGMVLRLLNVTFPPGTAMQVFGPVTVKGSAMVRGQDTKPSTGSQWDTCAVRTGTDTAIVARGASEISAQKPNSIVGPVVQHSTMDSASFLNFGDLDFKTLAAMADKKYVGGNLPGSPSPVGTATTCNKAAVDNWGEPYTGVPGCVNYFPLIYADRTVSISGHGRGQGILLIDGDLELTGGFEFWGVVVTTGAVNMHGTGGRVGGVVISLQQGALSAPEDLMLGNSQVQLSGCAVRRAVNSMGANRAVPVKTHSWFDLTSAGASVGF